MSANTPANKPGPESTLDDVRVRLIAAATSDLVDRGVDIGLADITLAHAIEAAGVTRSTAYRSLADDNLSPQEVLHREVLTAVLSRHARDSNLVRVQDAVEGELTKQSKNLASTSLAKRTAAFRQIIRVGANASYREVAESGERAVLAAAYGSLQSSGTTDWRHDALTHGEAKATALFADLYLNFVDMIDHKLRYDYTIEQFSTAAVAMLEGLALRHGLSNELDSIERPTASRGASEIWTLHAIMFEGVFTSFFEPIDAENPVIDLVHH